ncbi:MAG TPA: class I SAM-dependent methyltransferase [Micromonosporaceae bacterium]
MARRLEQLYDEFPRIEEEFGAALDVSLDPHGPDQLYEIVGRLGLPGRSVALDVGCGEGRHAAQLVDRFDLTVIGIDPVASCLQVARAAAPGAAFLVGTVEALPLRRSSVDLVWCRDVLVLVADLPRAYAEFARVLRPGGVALIYQMFATDLLEPAERALVFDAMGVADASADVASTDVAIEAAGLVVRETYEIGSEWGEYAQERTGKPGRNLLRAARLRRRADEYIERYGRRNYDIMLGDCLWHVYAMLGKLTRRAFVLGRPG